jgi:hypothetical protein
VDLTRRHTSCDRIAAAALSVLLAAGCAHAPPYVGQGPHPQLTRGRPNALVDGIGNVFGVVPKLLLWDRKIENHAISERTEQALVAYLAHAKDRTAGTHFALNQYAPLRDLKRLASNRKVAWPYRLFLGLPVTLVFDVALPGRLFGWISGGDSYNPYTDTVQIYSDLPAIALHEAGQHVHDFNGRRYKGTYALPRTLRLPIIDLYQEYRATDTALDYLIQTGQRDEELAAYRILYPAYGTYVGGYLGWVIPGGTVLGAVGGHMTGRSQASRRSRVYQRSDALAAQAPTQRWLSAPLSERPAMAAPAPIPEQPELIRRRSTDPSTGS